MALEILTNIGLLVLSLYSNPVTFMIMLIWVMFWKGMGLWYAGTSKQKAWFVALFLINSLGILPIIYLAFFSKKPFIKKINTKKIRIRRPRAKRRSR